MNKKRRGKFYVTKKLMESDLFAKVLAKMEFVPTTANYLYDKDLMEYHGYSHLFIELRHDEVEVEYNLLVSEHDGQLLVGAEAV